jgi:hypothetical protein
VSIRFLKVTAKLFDLGREGADSPLMGRKPTTCPKDFDQLIREARLFPPDATDATIDEFEKDFHDFAYDTLLHRPNADSEEHELAGLKNEIKTGHKFASEYIDLALEMTSFDNFLFRAFFRPIWNRTKELRSIAQLRERGFGRPIWIEHTSKYFLNQNATISEEPGSVYYSGLVERFIREKISVDRIRLCAVCKHVFWARNKRAETCGDACSDKLPRKKHGSIQKKG